MIIFIVCRSQVENRDILHVPISLLKKVEEETACLISGCNPTVRYSTSRSFSSFKTNSTPIGCFSKLFTNLYVFNLISI